MNKYTKYKVGEVEHPYLLKGDTLPVSQKIITKKGRNSIVSISLLSSVSVEL